MAATKYQVLYRYMNLSMNIPITNDQGTKYEETLEFYVDGDHRIFFDNPDVQAEEIEKQQQLIVEANNASNPKNDMLFVYDGTARVPHKKWYEEVGYVVRDWTLVPRSEIGNRGDFTKNFTTLIESSPEEGGIVVCSAHRMESIAAKYPYTINFADRKYVNHKSNKFVTTTDELQKMFVESSIFKLQVEDWQANVTQPDYPDSRTEYSGSTNARVLLLGPIFVDVEPTIQKIKTGYNAQDYLKLYGVWKNENVTNVYKGVKRGIENLETMEIPGHYEDVIDAPYLIKDQYKRIENSPWIVNCTVGSLAAALEKAKKLVDMIGIENVKVIKLVPFDQYLKII